MSDRAEPQGKPNTDLLHWIDKFDPKGPVTCTDIKANSKGTTYVYLTSARWLHPIWVPVPVHIPITEDDREYLAREQKPVT